MPQQEAPLNTTETTRLIAEQFNEAFNRADLTRQSGGFFQKLVDVGFQSTKLLSNLFHVNLAAVAIGIRAHLRVNENCLQFAANST